MEALFSRLRRRLLEALPGRELPPAVDAGLVDDRILQHDRSARFDVVYSLPDAQGVLQFPLLSGDGCEAVLGAVRGRENGTDGAFLREAGLYPLMEALVARLDPLLAGPKGRRLRFTNAFVVHYPDGSYGHHRHLDSSDLTVNVALNDGYEGGELIFSVPGPYQPERMVRHRKGWATVHDGRRIHGSRPVTGGPRYNLVIWADVHAEEAFARFPELPLHLQRLVLGFQGADTLSSLACCSQQLRQEASRDPLWWPLLEQRFDNPTFRALSVNHRPAVQASFAWMRCEDAKREFWAAVTGVRMAKQLDASQSMVMKCTMEMAESNQRRLETAYAMPSARDCRLSGLLPPIGAADPYRFLCIAGNVRLSTPPSEQAGAAEAEEGEGGSEGRLQEALELSRGTCWHLAASRSALVSYWVYHPRRAQWRGCYEDDVEWVCGMLRQAPQAERPPFPFEWDSPANPYRQRGAVSLSVRGPR